MDNDRVAVFHSAPPEPDNVEQAIAEALSSPIDFPALEQCVISDDRVTIAVDPQTPHLAEILEQVWSRLHPRGIDPASVTILQPATKDDSLALIDPGAKLPENVRGQIKWETHDDSDEKACAFLATATSGERIYLSKHLVEADVVFTIGIAGFDSLLGYRGTNSLLYPQFSNREAMLHARGLGHAELTPDDSRPLRQLVDEVGWLLGTQYSIQVVPATSRSAARFLTGAHESVMREAIPLLKEYWWLELGQRCDLVVLGVDAGLHCTSWPQIAAALEVGKNLVEKNGSILLLTDQNRKPSEEFDLVKQVDEPLESLQLLLHTDSADIVSASQLVSAVDWADVYLVSNLDENLVEDYFLKPLDSESMMSKLISSAKSCAFIESAQFAYGHVR